MNRLSVIRTTLTLGALVLSTGCASIVNSGYNGYSVTTNPPESRVTSNGMTFHGTPVILAAKRDTPHMIRIERDGCPTVDALVSSHISGWVWGNLLIGGPLGLIVDLSNEAGYELRPANLAVQYAEQNGKCVIAGTSLVPQEKKKVTTQAKAEMGYMDNESR